MSAPQKEVVPITGKVERVRVVDLHIRYIPIVTPLEFWGGCYPDMAVPTSPHVELYRTYKKHGYKRVWLASTRYVKERQHRREHGQPKWTDKHIHQYHLQGHRFPIYESMRKKGFQKKHPLIVLHEPFWTTRFDFREPWLHGPEIWTGAGRAAAAYVLGIESIYVVWHRDRFPGSKKKGKFKSKLKRVEGVWTASGLG